MSVLVARPVSHRSEVRAFALGLCAFLTGFSALVAADTFTYRSVTPSIPLYPNSTLVEATEQHYAVASTAAGVEATYITTDKIDDVRRFYDGALAENGWTKSLCGYYDRRHKYLLTLRISSENGNTTISVSSGRGQLSCDYAGGQGPHLAVDH
jgi:hypothetical protein